MSNGAKTTLAVLALIGFAIAAFLLLTNLQTWTGP